MTDHPGSPGDRGSPVLVSGIVLAGGASRRFGADKLAQPIDGVALVNRAVAALFEVADEIVVVLAPGRQLPALTVRGGGPPMRFATDPTEFEGPLAGIRTGLAAARGSTVVVVGGDMPSIVPAVLELLIGQAPAALADDTGVLRPLPVALEGTAALRVSERLLAGGERRLRALLSELGTVAVPRSEWAAQDPAGMTLVDIDEPADLAALSPNQQGPDLSIGALRREEPGP